MGDQESVAPRSLTGSRGQGICEAMYQNRRDRLVYKTRSFDPDPVIRELVNMLEKWNKNVSDQPLWSQKADW